MKKILTLAAVLAAGASVAEASTAVGPTVKCDFRPYKNVVGAGPALISDVPTTMAAIPLNAVQIVDKNIRKKILPQAVFSKRTATGTVEVMTRLVNCTDYNQEVLVRTSFMDMNQMPLEPTTVWKRVFLSPKATQVYSEKSISTGVGYFLIEVDEGD
ncbi:hypothetical protein [Kordiimonas laminariae]|uniref:hypothetical protein n=1 Tax=Kordiimonas laminariae TaxID=2917717 RepID=UPI001FF33032|nr:hypothetical protein [Kordiimonas laminariae]MCK0068177.1 hypothetical protein [Kordiimonas laminariae]